MVVARPGGLAGVAEGVGLQSIEEILEAAEPACEPRPCAPDERPLERLESLSYDERVRVAHAAYGAVQEMRRRFTEDSTLPGLANEVAGADQALVDAIYGRFNLEFLSSKPLTRAEIERQYDNNPELGGALKNLTLCAVGHSKDIEAAPGSMLCSDCQYEAAEPDPMYLAHVAAERAMEP